MPSLSVIIPAYESAATIAGCLEALARQTCQDFETIVVDSSPEKTTEDLVTARFPWVRFHHSPHRLLPHAARNLGVSLAESPLLLFTDPDVYPHPGWVERMVAAHQETGNVIVGAIACHGRRWRDQGIHLCKFSKWLPGGHSRRVDMGPTANLLLSRADFAAAGGLPGDEMLGDVSLSWRLWDTGRELRFEPGAIVEHHHLHTVRSFLVERYTRGMLYGRLRVERVGRKRSAALIYLLASVLPVRLPRILVLVAGQSARAGQTGRFLSTLPLIVLGHSASLAGEAVAWAGFLTSGRQR
ncbi:MAG TPA: glycosyltransferase [Thermoanaerobaculia bacterium]|nr:glycosyltransferase [Thermoanaerobaculia bacterium]